MHQSGYSNWRVIKLLSVTGGTVNILGFAGPSASVSAHHLCRYNAEAATDNTECKPKSVVMFQ